MFFIIGTAEILRRLTHKKSFQSVPTVFGNFRISPPWDGQCRIGDDVRSTCTLIHRPRTCADDIEDEDESVTSSLRTTTTTTTRRRSGIQRRREPIISNLARSSSCLCCHRRPCSTSTDLPLPNLAYGAVPTIEYPTQPILYIPIHCWSW